MGLASAGVHQVFELARDAVGKAAEVTDEVEDAAMAAGHRVLDTADDVHDSLKAAAMQQIMEGLEALEAITKKVTDPLP